MKQPIYILAFMLLSLTKSFGQLNNDHLYNRLWANKEKSIFNEVKRGSFMGITNGYLQVRNGKDTLILDFQVSKTTLSVIPDSNEMYDISTKKYSTQTTSGKTTLIYEIYALANILTVNLNGYTYSIGVMDGASDTPIHGLNFNYCPDHNLEFLTLQVTQPLELTTTLELMKQKNMSYPEASKKARAITILPGSVLILTIKK